MPKFRTITGQFAGYLPDSADDDISPDRAPMTGRVTFTPHYSGGIIAFPGLVPPEFARPEPIQARIVDGFVVVEVAHGTGDEVASVMQPLSLMVTVDDEATQVWEWRAEFEDVRITGYDGQVAIPSWTFRIPDGEGPIDLTEMRTVSKSPGIEVTKGPRGAGLQTITAVDGQLVFAYTDGQETTIPVPDAVQGPPGVDGAIGPEGPQGPQGEPGTIPDLMVHNIVDASAVGKELVKSASQTAARDTLGLQVGATAMTGLATELNNGVSNSSRVWTPSTIAEYATSRLNAYDATAEAIASSTVQAATPAVISARIPDAYQKLNQMDFFTSWDAYEAPTAAWTQGFSINEDAQEIYIACQPNETDQWVQCRDFGGTYKWDTPVLTMANGVAYSEGLPFYYTEANELCFILRLDPTGVRTYNTVTQALSNIIPVAGQSKMYSDGEFFYCADGQPTHGIITAVHQYTLASIIAGAPVLVKTTQLDTFGNQLQDNKPQGMVVRDGNVLVSAGKHDAAFPGSGRLDLRVYNPTGRIVNAAVLDKADFRRVLAETKRPGDTIPNETSFENEGLYPLRDGRIAVMNHLHRYIYITIHGSGSAHHVKADAIPYSNDSGWVNVPLYGDVQAYTEEQKPVMRRVGNVVYVRGAFKNVTGTLPGSIPLSVLPPGWRPALSMDFIMPASTGVYWAGYVHPGGSIRITSSTGGTVSTGTRLPFFFSFIADGLSF